MDLKPLRLRDAAHLIDKPRLANARIATNIHDVACWPGERCADNPVELLEFSLSSDETAAAGSQWFARHAAQPPYAHRCSRMPLKRMSPWKPASLTARSRRARGARRRKSWSHRLWPLPRAARRD